MTARPVERSEVIEYTRKKKNGIFKDLEEWDEIDGFTLALIEIMLPEWWLKI